MMCYESCIVLIQENKLCELFRSLYDLKQVIMSNDFSSIEVEKFVYIQLMMSV